MSESIFIILGGVLAKLLSAIVSNNFKKKKIRGTSSRQSRRASASLTLSDIGKTSGTQEEGSEKRSEEDSCGNEKKSVDNCQLTVRCSKIYLWL
jgi:hypothetical protein